MNSDWGQKGSGPIADRRKKLEKLRGLGIDPFSQDFCVGQDVGSLVSRYRGLEGGELDRLGGKFSVAGRVMGKRDFGKASFLDLKDGTGKIQCFVESASLSSEDRAIFGCLDVGDHLGVTGRIFKTRTGELTIRVEQLRILSKALRPLPEKWHGIRDVEARYRRRYLDLLMNPKARDCFRVRTQVVRAIRDFLDGRGFQEVETPMMQVLPGGAEALPFVTHHNALDIDLYLRIAPELYLKRLVIGGMERVYEINRNFRNEGISTQHNPEFTMLEFYQAYATFEDLMVTTEELFESLLERLHLGPVLSFQGKQIRMSRPWRKIRFLEGMVEIGKVPPEGLQDLEGLKGLALERGVNIDGRQSPAKILAKLFDVLVEPKLQDPTFVTHHPVEISPLARRNPQEPHLADRFELYIGGREIANAFTELTDPDDQRERFVQQKALREAGDQEAHPLDEDFLRALEHGMPPTAGEGIGIDRVVMLLTDSPSIRDVILFPLQRKEAQ